MSEYLAGVDEEQALSKTDQAMLRNCLIFEADVLMEMKKYQEASSLYRAMESKYMSQPAALEAIVGRASCARELGDDRASEMLFRQASDMFKEFPLNGTENLLRRRDLIAKDGSNYLIG